MCFGYRSAGHGLHDHAETGTLGRGSGVTHVLEGLRLLQLTYGEQKTELLGSTNRSRGYPSVPGNRSPTLINVGLRPLVPLATDGRQG